MIGIAEPYDVVVTDEIYRVAREADGQTMRICVSSNGQLRFSLPDDTPQEEVKKFIQVYALGVSDGKSARMSWAEDRIRGQLHHAARRLGRAARNWKTGVI